MSARSWPSGGSSNLGGYADPQADKLIAASVASSNSAAVTAEAQYLTQQQPSLFQPNPDGGFGTASIVGGASSAIASVCI